MDEPVELHNIVGHTSSVDGETIYEVPEVPKDDENEYMKINTLAERMTTSRTPRNSTPGNVDGVADIKSESDAAALRKVQIFCLVLLMMLITSSVTIGVLVNTLMQRTGDLKLKISELQNRPGALTGTDSTNIQELQVKVIQLERDTSHHTSLIHDHGSRILDHGSRITQLEIETAANDDNIVQQGKIISKLETAKTVDAASFHIINNTLELLTIDNFANKEDIQIQQARLNEIESVINLNQDNIQTLNDTILILLFDTSSNNVNSKLMIELLNRSIITLETNLTMQSTIIQDHSHLLEQMASKIEPVTTIRDLKNSLLQLETRVKTLAVAVSNNSISINLIHTDLEMAKNSLANLSNRVTVNEIDKQSDSAAVEDTQQRISRVEMDSNVTESLLQTIESRLTYLQDGLNCTWGNWTSFSSCSATCGDGLQYRERSLEGFVTDSNQQWCARKEIDIQTCIIKSCKPVDGGWGQWSPFSNCSQACGEGTQTRHRTCDNPEPLYGGSPCLGDINETQTCNTDPCPVDPCSSAPCGIGTCHVNAASYRCTCLNGWSGSTCRVSSVDCDFDVGLCSWVQDSTDNFDWSRHRGTTGSSSTGPNGDHTTGSGYYMYIETSSPRVEGDRARLLSTLLAPGHTYCMDLALNMYGNMMGAINIYIKPERKAKVTIQHFKQIINSTYWYVRKITIPTQTHNFNIVIEGVRGTDYHGDAAIDDIHLKPGTC